MGSWEVMWASHAMGSADCSWFGIGRSQWQKKQTYKITADIHLGLNAIRMRVTCRHLTFPPQHDWIGLLHFYNKGFNYKKFAISRSQPRSNPSEQFIQYFKNIDVMIYKVKVYAFYFFFPPESSSSTAVDAETAVGINKCIILLALF